MNYFGIVGYEISKEVHSIFYERSKKRALKKWQRIGKKIELNQIREISYKELEDAIGLKGAYEVRKNSDMIHISEMRGY